MVSWGLVRPSVRQYGGMKDRHARNQVKMKGCQALASLALRRWWDTGLPAAGGLLRQRGIRVGRPWSRQASASCASHAHDAGTAQALTGPSLVGAVEDTMGRLSTAPTVRARLKQCLCSAGCGPGYSLSYCATCRTPACHPPTRLPPTAGCRCPSPARWS